MPQERGKLWFGVVHVAWLAESRALVPPPESPPPNTAQTVSVGNYSLSARSQNDNVMAVRDLETILTNAMVVAREFGAKRLLLFGSALDNPAAARDLDLACEGVPGWKLFELASALERTLGVPLDLVPLDSPTPFTRLIEKRARVLL